MSAAPEADSSLRRIQRDSAVIAVAAAMVAVLLQRGRLQGALGVLAGAALMGVSYAAIKGGVTAIVRRAAVTSEASPGQALSKRRVAWTLVKFVGRYLLVAVAAWAVLVPLKAHPLGLFAGVTAPIAAIGLEALRLARRPPDRRAPGGRG
jgi:ABC-type polysaccharide/polyol phosphate export permease